LSGNGIAGIKGGGTSDVGDGTTDDEAGPDGSARCDGESQPTSRSSAAIDAISERDLGEWRTPAR